MTSVGVLTVGDQAEFRSAARTVVSATPGFELVTEAASAEEALDAALPLQPGLVLVAASMPGIDGFETSRRLTGAVPQAVVILVYANAEPAADERASSGAAAFLHRDALTPSRLRELWVEHGRS